MGPVEASAKTYTTKDSLLGAIRKNLLLHKTEITYETTETVMNELGSGTDLFPLVVAINKEDTSKDGDYLSLSLSEWGYRWNWVQTVDSDGNIIETDDASDETSLTFYAKYRTTLRQEKTLDDKLASVLKAMKLEDATDYEKVKTIHDYIIKRASYDLTLEKYTAYNLLIKKTAVCEGYASAAYRMFTDAGIECRIITGTGVSGSKGVGHAWNIVKVDGKWYNIDLTWDDPVSDDGEPILRYDFFLKNDKDFERHIRDPKYNTKAFLKKYPIAKTSYAY